MLTDGRVQALGISVLVVVSAALLVAMVQRTAMMRELEVELQTLRARRDGLDAWNSAARIELVRISRSDLILSALQDSGFVIPGPHDTRFMLYPGAVPGGEGVLTSHLAGLLRQSRAEVRGNETWLWSWVRRLPYIRDTGAL